MAEFSISTWSMSILTWVASPFASAAALSPPVRSSIFILPFLKRTRFARRFFASTASTTTCFDKSGMSCNATRRSSTLANSFALARSDREALPSFAPMLGNSDSLMSPSSLSVRPVLSRTCCTICGLYSLGSNVAATYAANAAITTITPTSGNTTNLTILFMIQHLHWRPADAAADLRAVRSRGTLQQPHFALRQRNDDVPAAEGFDDRLSDLASGGGVIGHADPRLYRNPDREMGEAANRDHRRRVLQHTRIVLDHVVDCGKRLLQIGVVGDADHDLELPDLAVVVEYLADDLAVGDDHLRQIGVAERGSEERDVLDPAFLARDRNVFA